MTERLRQSVRAASANSHALLLLYVLRTRGYSHRLPHEPRRPVASGVLGVLPSSVSTEEPVIIIVSSSMSSTSSSGFKYSFFIVCQLLEYTFNTIYNIYTLGGVLHATALEVED